MSDLPTLEDVARLSKTSRSTVSRVINNEDGVKDETRERVLAAIRQLNYQPNRNARAMATGLNHCIGVIVPRTITQVHSDPFFAPVMDSISRVAHEVGYSVMLWIIESASESSWLDQHLSQTRQIDGVVMIPSLNSERLFRSFERYNLPCITIGRFARQQENFVDIDNFGAALTAVNHLIELGYKRIAILTGRPESNSGHDRLLGYKEALQRAGLPIDPALIVDGEFEENVAYEMTADLLEAGCDAIFAMNDSMAIGALHAIQESGKVVPDDIAIVGFDDVPRASAIKPTLTTIRQPLYKFGESAAKLLLNRLQAEPHSEDESLKRPYVMLPTELVVRESCGFALRHGILPNDTQRRTG